LRAGAGLPAIQATASVTAYLKSCKAAPVFMPLIADSETLALATKGQQPDMPAFSDPAFDAWFAAKGARYGLGLYAENRVIYATDQFADLASRERRTTHLGVDVFAAARTPVYAPLAGRVRHLSYNADPLDYGHTLILEHDAGGVPFYTLYGHLGGSLQDLLTEGAAVAAGQLIAHLGDWPENGGWAPHLHFQVMTTMLAQSGGNFFGVGHASLRDIWAAICPDPNLILRLDPARFSL
jgi:murein DD-endopeptidase MepM/ murein hydrolase activator NlpD